MQLPNANFGFGTRIADGGAEDENSLSAKFYALSNYPRVL